VSAASPPDAAAPRLDERAAEAERSVTALFGGRLVGMPFTHLAHTTHPPRRSPTWNYWWQAHYLDAVVDAGLRCEREGDRAGARVRAGRGDRLLRTIRLRNGARWVNGFYDDMAWLALAAGRLRDLHAGLGRERPPRRLRTAERDLTRQLRSAATGDLGGGLFWSIERDFKNSPATGPAALHLARLGAREEAHRLVDWLYARLWSPESGLVLDGIRLTGTAAGGRTELRVDDVWSYNQGTVLGALVTLGDEQSLTRAAALVAAVEQHLTAQGVLHTHGGGDGGLFTGILGRYLALAATTDGLDPAARATAASLVTTTADGLWAGRDRRGRGAMDAVTVWSSDPAVPARLSQPPGEAIELSTQVQAWTLLEAAAVVGGKRPGAISP
jgi:predicted alpha-1,6-mannanase (GH76 family)